MSGTNGNDRAVAYLRERGITAETASENKIELCVNPTRSIYRLRLKFDNWHNGKPLPDLIEEAVWFPCRDANTTIRSWIMRPFPELPAKDGCSPVKFLIPRGEPSYPFIPAATWRSKTKLIILF